MKQVFCLVILILSVNLIAAEIVENDLFNDTITSKTKLNEEVSAGKEMTVLKSEKSKTTIPQIKVDPESRAYCASTYSSPDDDYISNVVFNGIDNTTVAEPVNSYGDYSSMTAGISIGPGFPLYVSFVSNGWAQHVWAWIDWNQDEIFDNSEFSTEKYDLGEGIDTTLEIDILVPEGAHAGNTRLRVIEQYNTDPSPCDLHENIYGETEDYTVNVLTNANYWTGNVDNNWHNPDNWRYHFVPDATTYVWIPDVTNKCWVYAENAYCSYITVEDGSGNDLRIYDQELVVSYSMTFYGQLLMDHPDGKIICNGNVTWVSGSRASILANANIEVHGDWVFNAGANVTMNNGSVNMTGAGNSYIVSNENNCYFNNLSIDKDISTSVSFLAGPTADLHINGDLLNAGESTFDFASSESIYLEGNLWNFGTMEGNTAGTFVFNGADQTLYTDLTTGETNIGNIIINSSIKTDILGDEISLLGDLEINNGDFRPSNNVNVDGSLMIFNGDWLDQVISIWHEFGGDIIIEAGSGYYPLGTTHIMGTGYHHYENNGGTAAFGDVVINKGGVFTLNTDMILPDNKVFTMWDGTLDLNGNSCKAMNFSINGSELRVDEGAVLSYINGIGVQYGGTLTASGVSGNNATIRNEPIGYSQIEIYGMISAEYTDFYNLGFYGVLVYDGASVDPVNCFNNCNFVDGINTSSSTRLQIDNNQTLYISNINFYNNPYVAGAFNISKTVDQGEVYIISSAGDFAGEAYENDPDGRINWGLPEINDLTIQHNLGSNEIELNWTYPIPVDHFKVYRSTDPYDFSGATVFTTPTVGYSEPATGIKYFYQVTADYITDNVDSGGETTSSGSTP